MNKNARIYIAGHTGFIGSALTRRLKTQGYKNLLLKTHGQLDLACQSKTEAFFKEYRPEYVFLLAAKVGGIQANILQPAEFIFENIIIQTNVMHAAWKYGVKKLLFLGSACMYPKFCLQPMRPEYLLTGPIEPTNEPFAVAKICGIKMCQAYRRQYRKNFICAVPATVYGPGDHFDESGHVVAGLIQKFHQAKSNKGRVVKIWGTGKPRREFLYIDDAIEACIFLMQRYNEEVLINIGTKQEVSVRELATNLKEISGYKGKIIYQTDKPDGIPRRLLDAKKIFSLGWKPKVSLDVGLRQAYNWYAGR
jgi:GDP-L-fucose synthase